QACSRAADAAGHAADARRLLFRRHRVLSLADGPVRPGLHAPWVLHDGRGLDSCQHLQRGRQQCAVEGDGLNAAETGRARPEDLEGMALRLGRKVFLGGLAGLAVVVALSARLVSPEPNPEDDWHLMVLGIAQDGGIPQLGCDDPVCVQIRNGQRKRERVASIGLVNPTLKKAYLIDATPDFVSQVDSLTGGRLPDAIFLTHAHIGHYTGLMFLGRESVDAKQVPVWGTDRMT